MGPSIVSSWDPTPLFNSASWAMQPASKATRKSAPFFARTWKMDEKIREESDTSEIGGQRKGK